MRFDLVPDGDAWAVWDGGANGWRCRGKSRVEAEQKALELNLALDQYGPRLPENRRQVIPPVSVDTWAPAGEVRWWVRDRGVWIAAVVDDTGQVRWIKSDDLRRRPG